MISVVRYIFLLYKSMNERAIGCHKRWWII